MPGPRAGHRLEVGRRSGGQHGGQDLENHRDAAWRAGGVAVVQQHDGAGLQAMQQLAGDAPRIADPGVEPAYRPAGQSQTHPGEHRVEKRIAQAGRRAEKERPPAGDRDQGVLRGLQLPRHAARAHDGKVVAMVLAVVFNRVAAANDFPAQRRVTRGLVTNAEKRGPGGVTVQQVQHLRCDLRVGPVVDGQGDFVSGCRGRG